MSVVNKDTKKKVTGTKKKTSIGKSALSRPTNKHKKKNTKPYRGQGK